jgi:hypothetical protein
MTGIWCLMVGGGMLTDDMRTLLYAKACEMYRKDRRKGIIRGEDYEVVVRTKFEHASLGSAVSGTKFRAELACHFGTIKVSFVVQSWDLEKALEYGSWGPYIPENHPSRHAYNN